MSVVVGVSVASFTTRRDGAFIATEIAAGQRPARADGFSFFSGFASFGIGGGSPGFGGGTLGGSGLAGGEDGIGTPPVSLSGRPAFSVAPAFSPSAAGASLASAVAA